MHQVIWVEVLSRHRHVLSRQRCDGGIVRIGRAYTNDIVLDDPYVASEHALVRRDEGGAMVIEDLGSANGLYLGHGRQSTRRIVLGDDDVVRMGQTYLRARGADYPVAAERVAGVQRRAWPVAVVTALTVAVSAAGLLWLSDYGEPRIANYVVPLLAIAVLIAVWSALWAMASRILSGQARFEASLLVALAGALGFEAWYVLSTLGAYGFSSSAFVSYRSVGFWCILAAVCFAHLLQIRPGRARQKLAVVASLLAVVIAVQIVVQLDPRSDLQSHYVRRLLPPAFRLMPAENEASFFAAVEEFRGRLDRDRVDEP